MERKKNMCPANTKHKKTDVALLISHKEHYYRLKGSFHSEGLHFDSDISTKDSEFSQVSKLFV